MLARGRGSRGKVVRGLAKFAGWFVSGLRLPVMGLRTDGPVTESRMVMSHQRSQMQDSKIQLLVPWISVWRGEEPAQRQGWLLVDGID